MKKSSAAIAPNQWPPHLISKAIEEEITSGNHTQSAAAAPHLDRIEEEITSGNHTQSAAAAPHLDRIEEEHEHPPFAARDAVAGVAHRRRVEEGAALQQHAIRACTQ